MPHAPLVKQRGDAFLGSGRGDTAIVLMKSSGLGGSKRGVAVRRRAGRYNIDIPFV